MTLRNAGVRYETGGPIALDGIDLDLSVGRRVALVGPSGAGKSTVAAVLLRFCDLTSGSATMGGHDLRDYRADDVRTVIGGCPQDPHIFDASIKDNIMLARPAATPDELAAAARQAGLTGWIGSLPQGWDTPAGPRGSALSGGERQRIALARALLAAPDLLVLDEPVAHLDPQARAGITAGLLAATTGRAILLITHELRGLGQVDEIVVLEAGTVAGRGTHTELLRDCPLYRRAWAAEQALTGAITPQEGCLAAAPQREYESQAANGRTQ